MRAASLLSGPPPRIRSLLSFNDFASESLGHHTREALIKSHVRDQSGFVLCLFRQLMKPVSIIGIWISISTKPLWSFVRVEFYWVASAAASAVLRILPRYLPWLRCDALHPAAPDTTRVARLNQCFLKLQPPGGARSRAAAGFFCTPG